MGSLAPIEGPWTWMRVPSPNWGSLALRVFSPDWGLLALIKGPCSISRVPDTDQGSLFQIQGPWLWSKVPDPDQLSLSLIEVPWPWSRVPDTDRGSLTLMEGPWLWLKVPCPDWGCPVLIEGPQSREKKEEEKEKEVKFPLSVNGQFGAAAQKRILMISVILMMSYLTYLIPLGSPVSATIVSACWYSQEYHGPSLSTKYSLL